MNFSRYERQLELFGEEGQRRIRDTFVVVVGAGGIGSHVIQQLAFLGVGKLAIIDSDKVEETDLNRLIGSLQCDVAEKAKKVDAARRLVHDINPLIEVTTIPKDLIDEESFSTIKKSHFVFGCVDNDGARLVLTELCSAFEIPYIDTASDIVKQGDHSISYGGRIFLNNDKNGCLHCYGLISPQAQHDLMSDEQLKDEQSIYGVPKSLLKTGPSVVSINGVIASLAVTEFMVSIVKLRAPNRLLHYHGYRGVVNVNVDPPTSDCYYCNYIRGRKEAADVDRYWRMKQADK